MFTNSVDPLICNTVLLKDKEGHILGTHLKFPRSTTANTFIKKKYCSKEDMQTLLRCNFFLHLHNCIFGDNMCISLCYLYSRLCVDGRVVSRKTTDQSLITTGGTHSM